MENIILHGDCLELSQKLENKSVRLVACSPPYAMQRKKQYGGVSEEDYPEWTVNWMTALWDKITDDGSIFIVIRPNIKNGQISDYVLKTRLLVRKSGWKECEELIWFKPDAPPLGSCRRPRRTWESILWFSKTGKPFCDLKACGNQDSNRVGGFAGSDRFGEGGDSPLALGQHRCLTSGVSRCTDVLKVAIGSMDKGVLHPAMYPQGVPDYLVKTFSQPDDLILDPFCGSGQTGLTAIKLGRKFIGFDVSQEYVDLAKARISEKT